MSKRSQQESLLLGVVVGVIAALAIVIPVSLLPIFGNDDSDSSSSQSAATPATTTVVQAAGQGQGNGNGGAGQGQGQGNGGAGNGGGGNGSGQGNGNGPGNGAGQANELGDPLLQGVASDEVLAAFDNGGCVACHNIKGVGGGAANLGPGLSRVGFIAAERRPGYEPLDYIEESIRDPGAFVRTNCPTGPCIEGLMPQTYSETLTAADISTIVNYLAALGTAAEADVLFDAGQ